jgi:hypothetical protein
MSHLYNIKAVETKYWKFINTGRTELVLDALNIVLARTSELFHQIRPEAAVVVDGTAGKTSAGHL